MNKTKKWKNILSKINPEKMLIWTIISCFILFIFTFAYILKNGIGNVFVNSEPKIKMAFVFHDDMNIEYSLFDDKIHGAMTDWSFLFPVEKSNNIYWPNTDNHLSANQFSLNQLTLNAIYSDCKTPWWDDVDHWKFVLAYQQREDNPEYCNIQKRSCDNWKLSWTFIQESCEDVSDDYEKVEAELYNNQEVSVLIKWKQAATTDSGKYFVDDPISEWNNNADTTVIEWKDNVILDDVKRVDCITDRGEKVNSGQFVKSYKNEYWFNDYPCQVKLVYCNSGEIVGGYNYPACTYIDNSLENFYAGWDDPTKPSIKDMIDSLLSEEDEVDFNLERIMTGL